VDIVYIVPRFFLLLLIKMIRTIKYRLYPNKEQEGLFNSHISVCCWLYNTALEQRVIAYKKLGVSLNWLDQKKELRLIKKEFPEFNKVHSHVLVDVIRRLEKSFIGFFNRFKNGKSGFPRFKSFDRLKSFTYPLTGYKIYDNHIKLSKIGLVRIRKHREIPENAIIKTCTIKKSGNKWYCSLAVEYNLKVQKKVVSNAVGVDLGLNSFAVLSDESVIDNPRYYRKSEENLKCLQSKYSTQKGKSTKRKLSNLHRKVANQRMDFLHKKSRKLINSFDLIAHEDLNIKGLSQMRLSKSVHDAGWGMFINMLTYKAEEAGTHVVAVNPYRTSQTCSYCGTVVKKTLAERDHNCPVCGLKMDRDLNAAHNILKLGTSMENTFILQSHLFNDSSR